MLYIKQAILLSSIYSLAAFADSGSNSPNQTDAPDPTTVAKPALDNAPFLGCQFQQYSVSVSTTVEKLNISTPADQSEATALMTTLASINVDRPSSMGKELLNKTYEIYGQLCQSNVASPNNGSLLVLTHGIGFDHRYWDDFAKAAQKAGYSTFLYDRLGNGLSSKPPGITEVQLSTEIAIAGGLIGQLRNISSTPFEKVIGVGHSFGSLITNGVVSQDPKALDAVVLTGLSRYKQQQPFLASLSLSIASQRYPSRFANLPNDYLVTSDEIADQTGFLHYPDFSEESLEELQLTKSTATLGELLTSGPAPTAQHFSGPVLVMDGEFDLPFCGGNCKAAMDGFANEVVGARPLNPGTNDYTANIVPGAGHAINLHKNAPDAYGIIIEWLSGKRQFGQ